MCTLPVSVSPGYTFLKNQKALIFNRFSIPPPEVVSIRNSFSNPSKATIIVISF